MKFYRELCFLKRHCVKLNKCLTHSSLLFLLLFSFYFSYDFYTGKVFYAHNDFAGMYFPFRQWFLERLFNFEFPLWNPYWGIGHEAVIWATVPIDLYSIFEIIPGFKYAYFYLIQCIALLLSIYYVFRKINFAPWVAVFGSLLFFLSPVVNYWFFEFINTNTFIAHAFTFLFLFKWFETGEVRYVLLMGWAIFFGMFGTKLEFWFFETVYFVLLVGIAWFVYRPPQLTIVVSAIASIILPIIAHSWQFNLLINALNNSGRIEIPHRIQNLFSTELYNNLLLSLRDTDFFPLLLTCLLLLLGLHTTFKYRWGVFVLGFLSLIFFKAWNFAFLLSFFRSPLLLGAALATIAVSGTTKKDLISGWLLFMLPAYYWYKPMINFDETYILQIAPFLFKLILGFMVWLGCLQFQKSKIVQLSYFSILAVILLENQGQIILSYLSGYLWIPGRDTYLVEFAFVVIAVYGTTAHFRGKLLILILAPLMLMFSAFPIYYSLPAKHIPGYANPLITSGLHYDPFVGVPGLKNLLQSMGHLPYRRALDPDIEQLLPQNHGTFLLAGTGNATFYGSMGPARYNEFINYYRYGITPADKVSGYPSVYSEKTISRLPKTFTKGMSNGLIYYAKVWTIPPLENNILRLLGVEYIITRNEALLSPLGQKVTLDQFLKSGEFIMAKPSNTLPRAFLVTNVTEDKVYDFKNNMKPDIELIEGTSGTTSTSGTYIAKPATIIEYKPEYVAIQVESPSESHLVLTDVFHPYWSAMVDGKSQDVVPAFHTFRAVKVPVGSHKVEFFCKIPYQQVAFIVSLLLIGGTLAFTWALWDKIL